MESCRYSGKIRPGEALIKTLVYPPSSMFVYRMRWYANLVHPQILGVWWSCDRPMPGPSPAPPSKPGKSALGTMLRLIPPLKNSSYSGTSPLGDLYSRDPAKHPYAPNTPWTQALNPLSFEAHLLNSLGFLKFNFSDIPRKAIFRRKKET